MPTSHDISELMDVNRRLLESIDNGDWDTYTELCDLDLTAFEPEALGHLVKGLQFHRYYFNLESSQPRQSTISSPHVRLLGDVAVVTYTRLSQFLDADGAPQSTAAEETRIWQHIDGRWRHIHFHRSRN